MSQLVYKFLTFSGSACAGSGLGIAVPCVVEYSGTSGAFDLTFNGYGAASGSKLAESRIRHEKNLSSTKELVGLLLKRNRRQMRRAYKGLDRLIVNRFEEVKNKQKRELDEVEGGLSGFRETHQKIIEWQKDWVEKQDKQISEKFNNLKKAIEGAKDKQRSAVDSSTEKSLLSAIDGLIEQLKDK